MVSGPTGSGKSSMLAACAGEMTALAGIYRVERVQPPPPEDLNELPAPSKS